MGSTFRAMTDCEIDLGRRASRWKGRLGARLAVDRMVTTRFGCVVGTVHHGRPKLEKVNFKIMLRE